RVLSRPACPVGRIVLQVLSARDRHHHPTAHTTIQPPAGHGYARPRCLVARTPAPTRVSLESSRVRPVRPTGDAAGRGRADAVAGRRTGACPGGFDIGQLVRLGVPARLTALRTDRRATRAGSPDAR